jgi:hypothetical protein
VNLPGSLINAIDAANTITIIVGESGLNDPVAGQSEVALPISLIGKQFIIEQRAFGQLRPDEYEITVDNKLRLLGGKIFSNGDTYFYKVATLSLNTHTGAVKKSFIANYVYYHFMRNADTATTGAGEVKSKAENSTPVSPAQKVCSAWNELSQWICDMIQFLDKHRDTYTGWSYQNTSQLKRKYGPINIFGI